MNIKRNLCSLPVYALMILLTILIFSSCKKEVLCEEVTWYIDTDSDGLGDPNVSIVDCEKPPGYVSNSDDSDDTASQSAQRIEEKINSAFVGESYAIQIFLPEDFATKNLPVLYILDGKSFFEDLIQYTVDIDLEAIIVGVADHLYQENFILGDRDFVPGFQYEGADGGHLKFYSFLTEELIPYIDNKYVNNHDARTLIGHNPAGLFTNFALLNKAPEDQIFSGFISINAPKDNRMILSELAENLTFSQDAKNIKLHISQVSSTLRASEFFELLVTHEFPWLEIDAYTFADDNTDSMNQAIIEPSIKRGLQFIYD